MSAKKLARELDAAAARHEPQLLQFQSRPVIDGARTRNVEAAREFVIEACGILGIFWQAHSASEVRDSKSARRQFVREALKVAELPHPDNNDHQALDSWIEMIP